MKRILLFLTFSITVFCLKAQDFVPVQDIIKKEALEETFIIVEVRPEFPGGIAAMHKYISENIQYPVKAINSNIEGTVVVTAIIEKDGTISNIKVKRV
jgi:hypothetical protein